MMWWWWLIDCGCRVTAFVWQLVSSASFSLLCLIANFWFVFFHSFIFELVQCFSFFRFTQPTHPIILYLSGNHWIPTFIIHLAIQLDRPNYISYGSASFSLMRWSLFQYFPHWQQCIAALLSALIFSPWSLDWLLLRANILNFYKLIKIWVSSLKWMRQFHENFMKLRGKKACLWFEDMNRKLEFPLGAGIDKVNSSQLAVGGEDNNSPPKPLSLS